MLALLGYCMVAVFMALIMTKRMSALLALIIVPILFALIGGFYTGIGDMMLEGIKQVAPTGVMLVFAILYFGVMIDAGLFEPIVNTILRIVKGDPLKIALGTVALASLVALDGDGTTTFIITVTAMLPLYKKLNMNLYMLATLALLSIGVMNMTPWGGPTARVISSLQLTTEEVFLPLIPVMAAGILFAFLAAWYFGLKERKRIGIRQMDDSAIRELQAAEEEVAAAASRETLTELKRPKLIWVNAGLTIALLIALIAGLLPLPVLFMLGFAIAAMINYPNLVQQKERIAAHAGNVLAVVALVFASGIFTGIMNGTEMVDAMATALVQVIPDQLGSQLPLITAITSMPFTYFMANDPYYYGIIPIIGETAASYNIPMAEIARASVLGQPAHVLSPLYAAGYLLVGMIGIDYGQNQRFALKWAVGSSLFMIIASILFGVISI
ncbi:MULTISPECIES: CitMHS family transporter [Cytobacillus]|uniref:Citrate:proton symporter n=1 Tax=Cytobacillus firmus TaxID=1399 RepID=A0AA46P4J4_CYTFI|nr:MULTISPECIES: citrate:proton symporter [Cytobacillus]MCC3649065.1 citrate transporter [Cytobacillus oceanisediminis]MCS0655406.1 citrate:proton symporter [Cytobacillus firmus]MCU1807930.1 citrate:proton symporter [Cytobacillus firmus]UYG97427.1 citrate:proton symporter [Cytobacillus firmus]